ncbi:Metacaspase-9 [Nymphaea thermarum]|nr:Metacaspase-9 [Nymphaea thermarum]
MEAGKKRLATLVGCNYRNTSNELHGCINDVVAMQRLLLSRFGFEAHNITLLTDEPDSSVQPTGSNIRQSLEEMIRRADPGDVLLFHYSGHGTLLPAHGQSHQTFRSREEAIVPCDFNLITDVDFRHLVDQLPAGSSFTMISDSCHSGGLIDKEKEQIGPSTVLQSRTVAGKEKVQRSKARVIPFNAVLQYLANVSGIDSPEIGDHLSALFGREASLRFQPGARGVHRRTDDGILMSGCQSNETSADACPTGDPAEAYGAFSNALQMALREVKGRIGNRELVKMVRKLLREGEYEQHPCLYCSDQNADAPFLWQPIISCERKERHSAI